ncbi:MAG: xylulokinase [Clostridia bacterium]|nr:xylulokinase [Clostridia bacterium]
MGKYYMSVDLGTSSVRAFIADLEGRVYHSAGEGYDVAIPRIGWAEQDPALWYDRTVRAIRAALERSGVDPRDIAAVSFSGQMHGTVAVDESGKPLMNAIIWMDQRSGEVLDEIYERVGAPAILEHTQNRVAAGYVLGTLYWLKTRQPELFGRVHKVMLPKDYVKYRLSGVISTDFSDAAGSLTLDNRSLRWARPVLDALGIPEAILPDLGPSTKVVGHVTEQAARETGLSTDTLVVNGGGDSFMQAVGNAIIEEGVFSSNIGTGGQVATTVGAPIFDPKLRTSTFAHVVPGRWQIMGGVLNSGISLKWITRQVLRDDDYDAVNRAVAQCPPGANGLFFLPYLTGERTPHMDPKARGAFVGLTLDHGRAEMERAVMEGVACALRDCLEVLLEAGARCDRIVAAGGGARSDVWLQIQADIFDRDVYRSASLEQACLGAAITAAVGAGAYPDFETACAACVDPPNKVFHPIPENVAVYRRGYPIFREIYKQNKGIFHQIDDMTHK